MNPWEEIHLTCLVRNKAAECRWEKDDSPVGMFIDKYWWEGNVLCGDCSLIIKDASTEYDNGQWQCQVTASDFKQEDTLFSNKAEVIVRGEFHSHILF